MITGFKIQAFQPLIVVATFCDGVPWKMQFPHPQSRKKHSGSFNRKLPGIILFLSALLCLPAIAAQAPPKQTPPKVAFLVPNPPNEQPFWTQVTKMMKAVAEDLNIDLQVAYSKAGSYNHKKDGLALLNSQPPPDYFLTLYLIEATKHHLERAEQLNISTFIFNAGVTPEDRAEIGRPRGKYPHWLGQMVPEDRKAGYLLADTLIAKAKAAGKTDDRGKVHLINVGAFGASIDESREEGLNERLDEQDDALVKKTILTGWSAVTAYRETLETLKQQPDIGAIWCVSDATALGAVKAVKESGKTPGRDIFIGGIDWSREGLNAVAAGDLTVSVGGHFLEGARALILIHDYHYGIDFADESGVEMKTAMQPITADNVRDYQDMLNNPDWRKVDFKQFSRKYNPGAKVEALSLHSLLQNLSQAH